jgi:intracellular sulfur oxidation DsrE/DsrF family protein
MRCLNKAINILLYYQCILQLSGNFQFVTASSRSDNRQKGKADLSRLRDDIKKHSVDGTKNNVNTDKVKDNKDDGENRYIIKYKKNASHRISQSSVRQNKKVLMSLKKSSMDIEVMSLKPDEIPQIEMEDDVEYVEKGMYEVCKQQYHSRAFHYSSVSCVFMSVHVWTYEHTSLCI